MTTGNCSYCGADGVVEADHVTGRDNGGRYFDSVLTLDACPACNKLLAHVWRAAGLDRVAVHPMATRLMRSAIAFDKAADLDRPLILTPAQTRALAELHRDAALVIVGLVGALVLVLIVRCWSGT